MINQICDISTCTGCGACRAICPKSCITLQENSEGIMLPQINHNLCIECQRCINTCPNNKESETYKPLNCFAGWSKNDLIRHTSASGGIATEIYRYCAENHIFSVGCEIKGVSDCHLKVIMPGESISKISNSKYVFSYTGNTYKQTISLLDKGEQVIFIALPCQIAGLKNCLSRDYDNLTTVDIVCHGVAPQKYLNEHVNNRIRKNIDPGSLAVNFRNPNLHGGTSKFWFTISINKGRIIYSKRVNDNDQYQYGYHKALIYRENCYKCLYAKGDRVGDITLSDFSGLGRLAPWNHDKTNVSCILVNTTKGKKLLESIKDRLFIEGRPIDEALRFEKQLSHPSIPHPKRKIFLQQYAKNSDFDKSVNKAVGNTLFTNHIKVILHTEDILRILSRLTPRKVKKVLRIILNK